MHVAYDDGQHERDRQLRPPSGEAANMENLSYVATVGGSLVSILIIRWTYGHFDISGKRLVRSVVVGGAVLVGSATYFFLGFIFILIRPEHTQEILTAILHGFGIGSKIILFGSMASAFALSRPKIIPAQKQPEGSVRQRLLNARGDIRQRIEILQSSPVFDYRGGIPEPDILIEELAEELKEIDGALATLEPNDA
jgi:hypothetical protein